ncbi:Photosystem II 5 kDa protein, chloroplastic [Zostera marina]|uniref:Photosystem II 5 kDa protein, chloroplastic n=1 Tax=Zostera marina TaxID=29655 RepID=A0A0K9NQW3_ZOSMR|nr:Photosystem II 5 kDa protein, chloroplastic [Zostera marina]
MASSLTMATLASSMAISTSNNPKRLHVPIKASSTTPGSVSATTKPESSVNSKRAVIFAAAAAAITAVVVPGGKGGAFAEEGQEDPKRGSPESKKKYAPICVTMPTANACHH